MGFASRKVAAFLAELLTGILIGPTLRAGPHDSPPWSARLSAVLGSKYGGELRKVRRRVTASTAERRKLPQLKESKGRKWEK